MIDKTVNYYEGDNKGWIRIQHTRFRKEMRSSYLERFDIDDYLVYKNTRKQRLINKDEFYNFKYSGYILFRKDLYNQREINEWIELIYYFGGVMYLSRPFPPNYIKDKIRIIE